MARRWCIYPVHACQVSWRATTESRRLSSVSSTLSLECRPGFVAGFPRTSPSRITALRSRARPVMSRHFHLICSSYLTRFRRADRVSGAQHILRQRLVARHRRPARTLIYDRHSGRRELSSARVGSLEIWHGSLVFMTRFSLLWPPFGGGWNEPGGCVRARANVLQQCFVTICFLVPTWLWITSRAGANCRREVAESLHIRVPVKMPTLVVKISSRELLTPGETFHGGRTTDEFRVLQVSRHLDTPSNGKWFSRANGCENSKREAARVTRVYLPEFVSSQSQYNVSHPGVLHFPSPAIR